MATTCNWKIKTDNQIYARGITSDKDSAIDAIMVYLMALDNDYQKDLTITIKETKIKEKNNVRKTSIN